MFFIDMWVCLHLFFSKGYQGLDEYLSLGMTGGGGGEALVMGIRDIELGHG